MTITQETFSPTLVLTLNGVAQELILNSGNKGAPGQNGRSVDMQVSGTVLQWRLAGADTWIDLFDISVIVVGDTTPLSKDDDYTLTLAEAKRWIKLNGAARAVTLTINPALFTNETAIRVYCEDNSFPCTVEVTTGVIKLSSLIDVTTVELNQGETLVFACDGTNLFETK